MQGKRGRMQKRPDEPGNTATDDTKARFVDDVDLGI
jgi:hypothetical protein